MRFEIPEVLSTEPTVRDGISGMKYEYADGSTGFKPHDSDDLIVTAPDNTITTYNSELLRLKTQKPDGTIEYYYNNKNNRKRYVEYSDGSLEFFRDDEENLIHCRIESTNENNDMRLISHKEKAPYITITIDNRGIPNSRKILYRYNKPNGELPSVIKTVVSYNEDGRKFLSQVMLNDRLIIKTTYDLTSKGYYDYKPAEIIEYYDDEYGRIKSIEIPGKKTQYFYNNEANSLKEELTSTTFKQFAEDGTLTLLAENIGKIEKVHYYEDGTVSDIQGTGGYIAYYGNGQLKSVKDCNGYKEYYNNDAHSLKEDINNKGIGYSYDEEGNKTAIIVKGKKIAIEDGKLKSRLIEVDGDKFLYNDTGDLLLHYDSKENCCYYGNGEKFIEITPNDYMKINLRDGTEHKMHVDAYKLRITDKGMDMDICYYHSDENWGTQTSMSYHFGLDEKISITDYLYGTKEEIDKEGTYIVTDRNNCLLKFGNKSKDIKWDSYNYGSVISLYITEHNGLNIKGYTKNGEEYSFNEEGNVTCKYEDGRRLEFNLRDNERRLYDKDNNLLYECDASGENKKWYEVAPDGNIRLTKEEKTQDGKKLCINYSYSGNDLAEVVYQEGYKITKRDIYNEQGKICSFEYTEHQQTNKVTKATYYNPENQTVNTEKIFDVEGKELSETQYKYYGGSGKLFSITRKSHDGKIDFAHYDLNGNEDTIKYLAIKRVAKRQVEKGEKLRQKAQAKGKTPKRMVTKKLNDLQKAIAMRIATNKIKKNVSK